METIEPDNANSVTASAAAQPQRATVSLVTESETGRQFVQGVESATERAANLFGTGQFEPLSDVDGKALAGRALAFEVEVERCFSAVADDNFDDRSEIYRYRLWQWKGRNSPTGPRAELLLGWEDFNGDDAPEMPFPCGLLLARAVARIRQVRYEKAPFPPVKVGS